MDRTRSPESGSLPNPENGANPPPSLGPALRSPQLSSNQDMGTRSAGPDPAAQAGVAFDGAVNPGTSAGESGPALVPSADSAGAEAPRKVSPWGARIALIIEVMIWLELGMILIFVPWKRAWTDNSLILNYPQLRELLGMNFVRGAVTGIGLLDLWIGISRAVYYKDPGKA